MVVGVIEGTGVGLVEILGFSPSVSGVKVVELNVDITGESVDVVDGSVDGSVVVSTSSQPP